jgi:hypothetical protein
MADLDAVTDYLVYYIVVSYICYTIAMFRKQWLVFLSFLILVVVFSVLRLSIISSHTVVYTYDQGRDFLAGARMITDRNPVFIGPTTGIGGLFHGAWWYYITGFSFLIFGADPIRLYYFLFFIHLISFAVFFFGMKKLFDLPTAVWTSLVIAVGDYYIGAHTFAGNNTMVIPAFIFFLVLLGNLIQSKPRATGTSIMLFCFGLSIGLISEFELSFGIFLIPTVIIIIILSKQLRLILQDVRSKTILAVGIIIPFLPRILFEIKNHFIQTNVLLSFFTKPKLYNPVPYTQVLWDRLGTFKGYVDLTLINKTILIVTFCALVYVLVIFVQKVINKNMSKTIVAKLLFPAHISIVLLLLFTISLVYRDPFWANYYEGIQYGFLVLVGGCVYILKYMNQKAYLLIVMVLILTVSVSGVRRINAMNDNYLKIEGLKVQQTIVEHITNIQKTKDEKVFCARVFTPPVIPYTYDYLWLWKYLTKEIETPRYEYVNDRCWYIIEPEWKGYEFRQVAWKKLNVPLNAVPIESTGIVVGGVQVVQYRINN